MQGKRKHEAVTISEFARRMGLTHPAVAKAVNSGRLVESITYTPAGKVRIDPKIAAEEWEKNTDHALARNVKNGKGLRTAANPAVSENRAKLNEAKTEREQIAAQQARLKFERESGRLVDIDKVREDAFSMARQVRDRMMAIPDRIAAQAAAMKKRDEVHALIMGEIRRALEGLANAD